MKPIQDENGADLIVGLDPTASSLYFWGWAVFASENYSFAYMIDDGKIVTDPSFTVAAEQAVLDQIAGLGGVAGNRFGITADITGLTGYHVIKALAEVNGVYYVVAEISIYVASSEEYFFPYAGCTDNINGVAIDGGWDAVYGYRTVSKDGLGAIITEYAGVTTVDNKITLSGVVHVNGGKDKLFYTVDGVNWIEIAEQSYYAGENDFQTLFGAIWGMKGGMYDFPNNDHFYTATIDLSAYAGQTVNVHVAVRSANEYNGKQQMLHLFTFTDVAIPAPHVCVFENYQQTVAPSCTTPGSETATCTCGLTDTRDIPVDADAHVWNSGAVVSANTVNGGYTLYTCTNNSEHTKKENETPAIAPAMTVSKITTNYRVAAAFDEIQWVADGRQAVHAGGSSATHIVVDATATTNANCLLTIKGWAILTAGQTGLVWSVDNTNWYNTVGGSYTDAEDAVLAAAKTLAGGADGSKMNATAANGRFNHVSADLSGYRGQTITVTFAVTNGSIVTPILNVTVTIPA